MRSTLSAADNTSIGSSNMYSATAEVLEDSFWKDIDDGTAKPNILEVVMHSTELNRTPERSFTNWVASLDTPTKRNKTTAGQMFLFPYSVFICLERST